jgi:23S rRNA pseudouridine2457 synthase
MTLLFYKPYGVISQFTQEVPGQRTLAEFGFPPAVYPVGRLDLDSEGLLLLSDEPALSTRLLDPRAGHWRRYLVQVEGIPTDAVLEKLRHGIILQGRKTLPARAWRPDSVCVPNRTPPIRFRFSIPTSWLILELQEGRNRQVRKMTAAVGHPTLRLVRTRIGGLELPPDFTQGMWRELAPQERKLLFLA